MKKLNFNQLTEVKTPEKWMEKALEIPSRKSTPLIFSRRVTTSAVVAAVMLLSVALVVVFGTRNNPPTVSPQTDAQPRTEIQTDAQGNTIVLEIEQTTGVGGETTNPFLPTTDVSSGLFPQNTQGAAIQGSTVQGGTVQGSTSHNGTTKPQHGTAGSTQNPTSATSQQVTQKPTTPQKTEPTEPPAQIPTQKPTSGGHLDNYPKPTTQGATQPPTNSDYPWWGEIPTESPTYFVPDAPQEPWTEDMNPATLKKGDIVNVKFFQQVNKYFDESEVVRCYIVFNNQIVSTESVMTHKDNTSYYATLKITSGCDTATSYILFYSKNNKKLRYNLFDVIRYKEIQLYI